MKKIIPLLIILLCLVGAEKTLAHQPSLIYLQKGDVQISAPEISQAFYDELFDQPKNYFINSEKSFNLYVSLLVPELANRKGVYSADIFSLDGDTSTKIASLDGTSSEWKEFYEPFGRDYYLQGPEFEKEVPAGKYKIEVFSKDNKGKYVLVVGKKETWDVMSVLNIYWQVPLLKIQFFKTDILQFFLTPFGIGLIGAIGALLIFLAFIYYLVGLIKQIIKHNQAKTLFLASDFVSMKNDIVKLLQKPAYDITVAFISTAAKPEEDLRYLKKDWEIMRDEMGFNLEEIDIEGKTEHQVMELLKLKDIIFVEGGNTFYLLNAMKKCNFERVIRKLLKEGKVYIGISAGSMVAGKTIKTSVWRNEVKGINRNIIGLKDLKGMNLLPFDIFVHYTPEYADIIKKKLPWKWQRKRLKIITDQQAILVQGRDVYLIGEGEAVNI
jgi:dipeptidase E